MMKNIIISMISSVNKALRNLVDWLIVKPVSLVLSLLLAVFSSMHILFSPMARMTYGILASVAFMAGVFYYGDLGQYIFKTEFPYKNASNNQVSSDPAHVVVHVDDEKINKLQARLEACISATEQQIKKLNDMEQNNKVAHNQVAQHDGAVDDVIKQEVNAQISSLKNEIKNQKNKQERKELLKNLLNEMVQEGE